MSGLVNTQVEPWEFTLPGLAAFRVAPDGSHVLTLADGVDAQCEAMVLDNLVDPLAWWRRGFWLLNGSVMVDPAGRAVLISSAPVLAEQVIVGLAKMGWCCLSDFLIPARVIDGQVLAYPRQSPVICSAAVAVSESLDIEQFVRPGGNAVGVALSRWSEPIALVAMATLMPEPPEPVSPGIGRARIARAMLVEVIANERTPGELLDIVTGLAVLPAWVSSDPLRVVTDPDAQWASDDSRAVATKAKTALNAALNELADWVVLNNG
ncbi:MAG: hypothetical protein F2806_02290 [Actinobacteria bacterium]|uniref:Unannotated protein n=1 Tax=freshwater metagenome TaxID=449393 RepID=A0A6J7FGM2_9ZZZZ|nr:hypothetical protein [Actinomycetota bacterium]